MRYSSSSRRNVSGQAQNWGDRGKARLGAPEMNARALRQEGGLVLFAPGLRAHPGQVDRRFLLPLPQDLQLGRRSS